MPDDTYHQIHFAWAEPTLLGRIGPGPAASSLTKDDQPALRSWRDRLLPALTADYRSALPGTDPADYPETLWARAYPDGRAALVYRWPGEVRDAHAWAIVGPARGLAFPRALSLHENPNTRPSPARPPDPGWATMPALPTPEPWERTAAPGAVRTRDRRAAETSVAGEPVLVGAVAAALARPDLPIHIGLDPELADPWQAVQLRFLWGVHRILRDVLTPPRAIPAAGWSWSFSTYDPVLGTADGQHLAFGPPTADTRTPFLHPPAPDHLAVAESLVTLLRDEGGDVLAAHLRERGVPEAPTFADRRDLLCDWLDPPARGRAAEPEPETTAAPVTGDVPGPPGGTAAVENDVPSMVDLPDLDDVPEPEWLPPEYEPPADLDPADPPEPDDLAESVAPPGSVDLAEPDDLPEPTDLPGLDDPTALDDPDGLIEPGCLTGSEAPAAHVAPDDLPDLPEVEAPETEDPDRPQPPPLWPLAEREPHHEPEPREPSAVPPATPDPRSPEDAPPLNLAPEPDYPAETAPAPDESAGDGTPDDNWPTHYVDIPLARLERWHSRHGPESARVDVVDARAAIRAERAELDRVLDERDRYHAEVQDLRREVARLDRPWLDAPAEPAEPVEPPGRRRTWMVVLLVAVVLALGLEAGARSGTGVTDLLTLVWGLLPFG
ncbi:hypothetical protein [Nocardiopsis sp. FIRDI 009]|uniref:hypothetical protein n=1 Tax=Nocardiopsis sp. FIRDI 009 TaxID=714197 RepID=UPI0018E591F6|nr:hypothetical protein [Nocardiopsis sp. FIRDI 009]